MMSSNKMSLMEHSAFTSLLAMMRIFHARLANAPEHHRVSTNNKLSWNFYYSKSSQFEKSETN